MRTVRLASLAAVVAAGLLAASCGKEGRPLPPAPRGPLPAGLVEARQIGGRMFVAFTVPSPRGGQPAQQPAAAEVLRVAYAPGLSAPVDPEAFRLRGEVVARAEGDPLSSGARLMLADPSTDALAGGSAGWTLRYAVRVRDRRGRPSALVAAADLAVARPAAAPADVAAEATTDGVRLRWASAQEGAKFNVYRARDAEPFGERPLNAQPLSAMEYLDAAAETGAHYRYVVRALLAEGAPPRETDGSPEATVLAEDRFAPASPTGLVAVQEASAVRLFWTPNAERDLAGYRLYRRLGEGAWERVGPDPIVEPLFLDEAVAAGVRAAYRVTAVDRAAPPNESEPSDPIEIDVVSDPLRSPASAP